MMLRKAIQYCAVAVSLTGSVPIVCAGDAVSLEVSRDLLRACHHEARQSVHRSGMPSALGTVRVGGHTANLVRLFTLRDDSVLRLHGWLWAEICRAAGTSNCVPSLKAGLGDLDPKWRAFSVDALGDLGEASAVSDIVDLLWDAAVVPGALRCLPNTDDPAECAHTVAHSAATALGKLTDVEFYEDLEAWKQWSAGNR